MYTARNIKTLNGSTGVTKVLLDEDKEKKLILEDENDRQTKQQIVAQNGNIDVANDLMDDNREKKPILDVFT